MWPLPYLEATAFARLFPVRYALRIQYTCLISHPRSAVVQCSPLLRSFTTSTVPCRRGTRPFLSVLPSAINLTAAIPLASINSAASAWERLQGRKLFAFTVESAPLPSCRSGDGPCAVWEVSTGRIVLDQSLVKRIGGLRDMPSFLGRFWTEVFNKVQDAAAAMTRGQVCRTVQYSAAHRTDVAFCH